MTSPAKFLDLPALPNELERQILNSINLLVKPSHYQWLNSSTGQAVLPLADHQSKIDGAILSETVLHQLEALYQPKFESEIRCIVAMSRNIAGIPSGLSPHYDRYRRTAINYMLALGGDNVVTNFYEETRDSNDTTQSVNLFTDQIHHTASVVFPDKKWITFNAQQAHNVENIVGTRVFLALVIKDNPSFEEFQNRYKHLFLTDLPVVVQIS